jgi:hypothetical protein
MNEWLWTSKMYWIHNIVYLRVPALMVLLVTITFGFVSWKITYIICHKLKFGLLNLDELISRVRGMQSELPVSQLRGMQSGLPVSCKTELSLVDLVDQDFNSIRESKLRCSRCESKGHMRKNCPQ